MEIIAPDGVEPVPAAFRRVDQTDNRLVGFRDNMHDPNLESRDSIYGLLDVGKDMPSRKS